MAIARRFVLTNASRAKNYCALMGRGWVEFRISLARDAFVRRNRRAIATMFVRLSVHPSVRLSVCLGRACIVISEVDGRRLLPALLSSCIHDLHKTRLCSPFNSLESATV